MVLVNSNNFSTQKVNNHWTNFLLFFMTIKLSPIKFKIWDFLLKNLNQMRVDILEIFLTRGWQFILIPKDCYEFFPQHSAKYLNDITLVNFKTPQGNIISRKYDWHNAKYHLNSRDYLSRDHDEKRLYRSKFLDKDLDLDRDVFFICCKSDDNREEYKYKCFSVTISVQI